MVKPLQFTCSETGRKRNLRLQLPHPSCTAPLQPAPNQPRQGLVAWKLPLQHGILCPVKILNGSEHLQTEADVLLSELLSAWLPAELQWRALWEHAMGLLGGKSCSYAWVVRLPRVRSSSETTVCVFVCMRACACVRLRYYPQITCP